MYTFNRTKCVLILLTCVCFLAGVGLLYTCINAKLSNPPIDFLVVEKVLIVIEIIAMALAVIGIYALLRHHLVLIFFYAITSVILMTVELGLPMQIFQRYNIFHAETVWNQLKTSEQIQFMEATQCSTNFTVIPTCDVLTCYTTLGIGSELLFPDDDCHLCCKKLVFLYKRWNNQMGYWTIGCCLAKFPGIFFARYYRNMKNPRSHSSAFI